MFTRKEIRKDHFNKTHTLTRSGRRVIVRDTAKGIKEPQGKKFVDCNILGISNYVRIDHEEYGRGGVVRRRKTTN